jgi:hypothetical protein
MVPLEKDVPLLHKLLMPDKTSMYFRLLVTFKSSQEKVEQVVPETL